MKCHEQPKKWGNKSTSCGLNYSLLPLVTK
jgi:hypothetical protein